MQKSVLDENEYWYSVRYIKKLPPRDRSILLLMLLAGLRVGEVCDLRRRYILRTGAKTVGLSVVNGHGQTNHIRYISCHEDLAAALDAHLADTGLAYTTDRLDEHVFVSRIQKVPLTTRSVQRLTKDFFSRTLGRPVHPHALRHTFATRVLRSSNLRIVQELLGHKSITSTQVYTHPTLQDQHKAISEAL